LTRRDFLRLATLVGASAAVGSALGASPVAARVQAAPARQRTELSFWSEWQQDPEKATAEKLIDQFNQSQSDVTIVHRPIENEQFFTVLRTGFTSGDPPDLFQHEGHNNLMQFVIPGEIEDISDFWEKNPGRFLTGTDQSIMYQGKYYGVPFTVHTDTQIYYNDAVLSKNGIDGKALKTWDDYLAAFEKLKSSGISPIAFGNKFGWPGSQWFFAFLCRWVGTEKVLDLCARKNDYKWTDPDIVQAAKFYTDLNDKGYFSSGKASDDYPGATALLFAGRAGFFQTGSWFIADAVTNAPPDFKLGMNVFPTIAGGKGDPKEIVMQAIGGLSISKKGAAKNRQAAVAFLDWITQLPQAQLWVKEASSISPVVGAVTAETANEYLLSIVNDQINGNTGSFPFLEHILPKTVGEEKIWMGSVGVLTGQLTAETWMQSVEEEAAKQPPTFTR